MVFVIKRKTQVKYLKKKHTHGMIVIYLIFVFNPLTTRAAGAIPNYASGCTWNQLLDGKI